MRKIAIEEHITKQDIGLIDQRLKDMDEAGIDMQVLSFAFPYDRSLSAAESVSTVKEINELLASIVSKYPDSFAAFATLPLHDPDAAADELERSVKQLGLRGTMTFSEGEYLDDEKYRVIFAKAAEQGVPLYLHPGYPSANMIEPYMKYPVLAGAAWGFAAQGGLHAMRLICSGVFDEYPGLKIILGHLGEGIPYWLWRIDNHWVKGLAHPELIVMPVKLQKNPGEYFRENFYVTTSGMMWPPVLQFVNSVLGADRILFAADYPPESALESARFIESMPMSNSDKEKICHSNAESLLKL